MGQEKSVLGRDIGRNRTLHQGVAAVRPLTGPHHIDCQRARDPALQSPGIRYLGVSRFLDDRCMVLGKGSRSPRDQGLASVFLGVGIEIWESLVCRDQIPIAAPIFTADLL